MPKQGMPPKTFTVGPFRYTIVFDRAVLDRSAVTSGDNDERDGETDWDNLVVNIAPGLSPDAARETIFHEMLHTVTDITGLRFEVGDEKDEQVVRRLSPILLDTLRRNSALREYFFGGGK